jgi:hypothetical protein
MVLLREERDEVLVLRVDEMERRHERLLDLGERRPFG